MGRIVNAEALRKALITAADALSTYGKLPAKHADKFIDYVFDESVMKGNVRTERFRNETLDIDKIGVGTRVTMPKTEASAPSNRRGVTTSKVSLTPKEVVVPFEISDTFQEINLEGADAKDHIVRMMATQFANDQENFCFNGDTLGPAITENEYLGAGSTTQVVKDGLLALDNGWLKLARSANLYNAAGTNLGGSVFSGILNALPEKFKRNYNQLRWFMSPQLEQTWREKFATRATGGGDDALNSARSLTPFGIPIVRVPLLGFYPQVVEHVTLTGTTAASLAFAPILDDSETVVLSTLALTPTTPYVEGTDYTMDYTNGTIVRITTGSIGSGAVVKITYQAYPQIVLTHYKNFIFGVGRDMRIEKDRDIYAGTDQYAIHAKVAVQFEELTAISFGYNIGDSV